MFVSAICMISLAAVSEPLIYTLIGPKWHEAATFLPLICISMSLYPLHAINLNMLQVLGRSDIFLYLEVIKKIISLIPIGIGIYVDIYWMLIASVFTGIIGIYLNSWYTGKALGYTFRKQLRDVAPSYLLAGIIAVSVYFIKYSPLQSWLVLIIQFIIGLIVFILTCEFRNFAEYNEIKSLLINLKNKENA